MASFTGVGDNLELAVLDKGESVDIAISGTYNMTILFQRETVAGGDAWETLETFDTANATEAETYVTRSYGENLRLIVDIDTSGTATATLTNAALEGFDYLTVKDRVGNTLLGYDQGGARFSAGLSTGVPLAISGAVTLTRNGHAGRTMTFVAAGGTVTLPAATGTGDKYRFFVTVALTTNVVIQVANATDIIAGVLAIVTDIAGVVLNAGTSDDTITLNQTTSGGLVGSFVELEDMAAGFWMVTGTLVSSGAEGDPFSAAVS